MVNKISSVTIQKAADLLLAGKLVAFPTETVYGLGADGSNPKAVEKIFAAKGRPADYPVIVHLASEEQLSTWASNIPPVAWKLAKQFWPGPMTLVLQKSPQVSSIISGGQNTIALRVPSHPVARELLRVFGGGIAAPSANRFGRISPTQAEHVQQELGSSVDLILDGGACTLGIESTIIDLSNAQPRILRPGTILATQINAIATLYAPPSLLPSTPRTPGTLTNHYAPKTRLQIVAPSKLNGVIESALTDRNPIAILTAEVPSYANKANKNVHWFPMPTDPINYAHDLYAKLREADNNEFSLILVTAVPSTAEWLPIADRLSKAATKT